ncbi:acyl carrier protein [Candidatus Uabimicrobium sp. HlEnr_7]|uniref:acyl carrier protein n=1 Tax=Candidatus Uabimicrobium helgolandensis TaxID=3095367 RepID=UPI003557D904
MKIDIYNEIVRILQEQCEIETTNIDKNLDLQKDLGLDSVGLLTLATEIENHWELYLNETPEDPPQTIEDLVNLIDVRLQEKMATE